MDSDYIRISTGTSIEGQEEELQQERRRHESFREFDFNFDPIVDQVVDYSPTKVDRNKVRTSTGLAKLLGVNDD